MPKISDIEETPNPNAVKFILAKPSAMASPSQYGSADQAENDPLAKSLFDVGHVVSVFYMDKMITVEKDDEGDWDDLLAGARGSDSRGRSGEFFGSCGRGAQLVAQ